MEDVLCGVCSTQFLINKYGKGICPNCGVEMEFVEGYQPQFDSEMVAEIKKLLLQRKEIKKEIL